MREDDEGQRLDEASTEMSRMKVPSPARISISPRLCRARRASRTEVRLTMNFSARSRSGGS